MREADGQVPTALHPVDRETVAGKIRELANVSPATPSHLYLELLRTGIREGWELDKLDLRDVTAALIADGWEIDPKTGRLSKGGASRSDQLW